MGSRHAREEGKVVYILEVKTDIHLSTCIAIHKTHKVFVALSVSGKKIKLLQLQTLSSQSPKF